ncbi:serine/threonine protein phosphatase [Micromonospora sp. KC213]|uniref:serine/threonine protein phosphatase n=1 Tax=Micromonospora sp. KC213 TaxID=2530378 RepID=UPI001044CAAA|nr:serine/threonine protein phosphatase [Micromonospora sp. KC213]TDC43779.1 serine/threonine protein phosphatase [Micromonospora sp. KC213]
MAGRADSALASLLQTSSLEGVGVGGGSSIADVDGVPVFVKRVPITDRELAHPHSTANLFDLPARWQYGMYRLAGPGFGAWRELAANQSVTEGVLAGEAESFPLLHHWRVLPGRPPVAVEHLDIDAVVAQFGGNQGVRARFEARAGATASLVLFLEYLPDRLPRWLSDPVGRAVVVERQLFEMVAFLRHREVLHMDGHFGNIRADDEQLYLVDFGLATSPRFHLSDAEREFAARNAGHDADYASMRLVNWLVTSVCGAPVPAGSGPVARNELVRRCATGDIPRAVPPPVADIIARHAPAAARMNDFCWRLFDGDLHAEYPGNEDTVGITANSAS